MPNCEGSIEWHTVNMRWCMWLVQMFKFPFELNCRSKWILICDWFVRVCVCVADYRLTIDECQLMSATNRIIHFLTYFLCWLHQSTTPPVRPFNHYFFFYIYVNCECLITVTVTVIYVAFYKCNCDSRIPFILKFIFVFFFAIAIHVQRKFVDVHLSH